MAAASASDATAETTTTLLSHLRSHGSLKRAYPTLRASLPAVLAEYSEPHSIILSAVEPLLAADATAEWPGSSASAYCSLLLDAAKQLEIQPTSTDAQHANRICQQHPGFFRKLSSAYLQNKSDIASIRPAALAAAHQLWQRGESGEVASLIAEFGLHDAFDVREVLRAAMAANRPHAVASLGGTNRPVHAHIVIDEFLKRHEARQAMKLMPKLGLTRRTLPMPMRRALRVGVMEPRMRWLARSGHWDLIDAAFAGVAKEVGMASAMDIGDADTGDGDDETSLLDAPLDDATAIDLLVLNTTLDRDEWIGLGALLADRLAAQGCRGAAVRGAVRHGLAADLCNALGGPVSDVEREAAIASTEDDVAAGRFEGPLALLPTAPTAAANGGDDDKEGKVDETAEEAPTTRASGSYLRLDLPPSSVFIVSDSAGLDRMLAATLSSCNAVGVLGIDVEWSDGDLGLGDGTVQWIQFSNGIYAYLLDVPALTLKHSQSLQTALHRLLSCPYLLKIGFGLKQDLARLRRCHPALGPCGPELVKPSVELGAYWQKRRQAAAPNRKHVIPGLAKLVEETFGQPLDKTMQMSNWARRPLVSAQIQYAALDAHCLVLLYIEYEKQRLKEAAAPLLAECVPPPDATACACEAGASFVAALF